MANNPALPYARPPRRVDSSKLALPSARPSPTSTSGTIPVVRRRNAAENEATGGDAKIQAPSPPSAPKDIPSTRRINAEMARMATEAQEILNTLAENQVARFLPLWVRPDEPKLTRRDIIVVKQDENGKDIDAIVMNNYVVDIAVFYANLKKPYVYDNGRINRPKVAASLNVAEAVLNFLEDRPEFVKAVSDARLNSGMANKEFRMNTVRSFLDDMARLVSARLTHMLTNPLALTTVDYKKLLQEFREFTDLFNRESANYVQHVEHSGAFSVNGDVRVTVESVASVLVHLQGGERKTVEDEILLHAEAIVKALATVAR